MGYYSFEALYNGQKKSKFGVPYSTGMICDLSDNNKKVTVNAGGSVTLPCKNKMMPCDLQIGDTSSVNCVYAYCKDYMMADDVVLKWSNETEGSNYDYVTDLKQHSWTVPYGVTSITAYIIGGGGGGGGGSDSSSSAGSTSAATSGAGGGGGGRVEKVNLTNLTPGQTITISIGDGGAGGPSSGDYQTKGTDGTSGFDTSITVDGKTYTAKGGTGGSGSYKQDTSYGGTGGSGGGNGSSKSAAYMLIKKEGTDYLSGGDGGSLGSSGVDYYVQTSSTVVWEDEEMTYGYYPCDTYYRSGAGYDSSTLSEINKKYGVFCGGGGGGSVGRYHNWITGSTNWNYQGGGADGSAGNGGGSADSEYSPSSGTFGRGGGGGGGAGAQWYGLHYSVGPQSGAKGGSGCVIFQW